MSYVVISIFIQSIMIGSFGTKNEESSNRNLNTKVDHTFRDEFRFKWNSYCAQTLIRYIYIYIYIYDNKRVKHYKISTI